MYADVSMVAGRGRGEKDWRKTVALKELSLSVSQASTFYGFEDGAGQRFLL
jgi:hypothetical protein